MLKMRTDWGTKRERAVWRFGTLGTGVSGQNCLTMGVSASSSGVWYGGIYGVLWCRLPPWWYGGQCSLSWPLQCELMAAWRTRRKWGRGVSCQLLTSPPHLFTPLNQFEVNFGWNLEQLKEPGYTHTQTHLHTAAFCNWKIPFISAYVANMLQNLVISIQFLDMQRYHPFVFNHNRNHVKGRKEGKTWTIIMFSSAFVRSDLVSWALSLSHR